MYSNETICQNGGKVTLSLFMKNMTNKILKITVQFLFSQIVVKIFEKLIFNKMFTYFRANDLMAPS